MYLLGELSCCQEVGLLETPPLELQDQWRQEDLGECATKEACAAMCRTLSNSGVGSEESYRFLKWL